MDAQIRLLSELKALRRCFLRSVIGFLIALAALAPFTKEIFHAIALPMLAALPSGQALLSVGVISPVMAPLKVLCLAAAFASLPNTLYQIWSFAAPGLYRDEKRKALLFVGSALLLALAGAAYCQFAVLGVVLGFISSNAPEFVSFAPDIGAYLDFVLRMTFAFALAFETPAAVVLLSRVGAVGLPRLRRARRFVIVGAFAVSAVLTPPDVLSQLLLALPLCLLYEAGLIAASLTCRTRAKAAAS
jgi:sec-independent protein translocase protein TatC